MDPQRELVQIVYDRFRETGEWPRFPPLQRELRHLGSLERLAAEAGSRLIYRDQSHEGGGVFRLSLEAVAQCRSSETDIRNFLAAIRSLAQRYLGPDGHTAISISELVSDLGLSELELRRLGQILYMARGVWSSFGSQPSGDATITPYERIWYFEEVQTLEDFYAALGRSNEDQRVASQLLNSSLVETSKPRPRRIREKSTSPTSVSPLFVDQARLKELRKNKNPSFDLRRLIALCEELNRCAANECIFATAMLTRAILDHVPPIFGVATFAEVASNYGGSKSFKESMQNLANSARKIGDAHLHTQIRRKEILPTRTQVDFSRDLDVLLAEIVRIL